MKIIGVTVGTTTPKPNFEQTDPTKGDYIKGDIVNAIPTDTTLTQDGQVADAAAVGNKFSELVGGTPVAEQIEQALIPVRAQLADLLYEPITISSLAIGNVTAVSSGTTTTTKSPVELGSTVTAVTISWATSKAPTTMTLDGVSIDTSLTTHTYSDLDLTTSKTYKLVVTDDREAKAEKSATLTFCNRVCYGVAAAPATINSDFVMSLATKTLATSRTNSGVKYNAGEGQYLWYCVPTRLGACTFTDVETGLGAGLALAATIDVTNASGYTESYYVYKSDYAGLGSLTVKVS